MCLTSPRMTIVNTLCPISIRILLVRVPHRGTMFSVAQECTYIAGFDLVPIQPDLSLLEGESSLHSHPPAPKTVPITPTPPPPPPKPQHVPEITPLHRLRRTNSHSHFVDNPSTSLAYHSDTQAHNGRTGERRTTFSKTRLRSSSNASTTNTLPRLTNETPIPPLPSTLPSLKSILSTADAKSSETPLNLKSRVQWVHGTFLERLPFPDDHFDFV